MEEALSKFGDACCKHMQEFAYRRKGRCNKYTFTKEMDQVVRVLTNVKGEEMEDTDGRGVLGAPMLPSCYR